MKDQTARYLNMLDGFSRDFKEAVDGEKSLSELDLSDNRLRRDIDLLNELVWMLSIHMLEIRQVGEIK